MDAANRMRSSGLDGVTAWLLMAAFPLSILHIADHVLRVDHSGWPFRPEVTPFTYSLLVFPMLLFALFGARRLYWWRWSLLLIATAATLYAHAAIETPRMQFAMWADNRSADPRHQGLHNILGLQSPLLGAISTVVAMALNLTAVAATIAMLVQGLRLERAARRSGTGQPPGH